VTKLAVMYVHGVEIADANFAETSIALLREEFGRIAGVDPDEALSIRTAFWAPVYEGRQSTLLDRMGGDRARRVFGILDALGSATDRGSVTALLGLIASGLVRVLPGNPTFHYPTLRWLIVNYVGDAIAYQAGAVDRELYDRVHRVLAAALHDLAADAGPTAPLCVIAHSLGTVVTSDFVYDLQVAGGLYEGRSAGISPLVGAELDDTPMERGETLAWFHSLGSPLALWAQRHPDFGLPITVPHPELARLHPRAGGEWINVWDPDDVIASPLRPLNGAYTHAVAEDRTVQVAPWWLGWTPLAHPFYWNDRRVVQPIASSLAQAWHRLAAQH
jgi:hypothetical protein